MLTNEVRRDLLNQIRSSGYPGGITEVFQAADQGIDLISQFVQQQEQQQMQVAQTQQQQETGLREEHAKGNTQTSMAFPDVQPNQSFNTVGMKAPIDIQKIDKQGHLVESYKNVPPGIQNLPTGPYEGTIIESPPAYQKGGVKEDYNTKRAEELGYTRDKTGHLPSVDVETGDWLKSMDHPTSWKEYMEYSLNPKLQKELQLGSNPEGYFGDRQLKYYKRAYQKGGYKQKYQIGGEHERNVREFEDLSERYKQRVYDWESSMGRDDWKKANETNRNWEVELSTMRDRLWELSVLVQAKKQSNPGSYNAPIDIQGGGTFNYEDDYWQDNQTPLFSFKPPKHKPISKMPIKQIELLPTTTEEPVLAKAVDVPEMKTSTIDEDLSKNFHHRKYKEEDGKYSMLNPVLGKWKPITKNSYKHGIKNSTYNEETDVYEQWWHKGTTKKESVTSESILEYLRDKKEGGFAKHQKGGYKQKYLTGGEEDKTEFASQSVEDTTQTLISNLSEKLDWTEREQKVEMYRSNQRIQNFLKTDFGKNAIDSLSKEDITTLLQKVGTIANPMIDIADKGTGAQLKQLLKTDLSWLRSYREKMGYVSKGGIGGNYKAKKRFIKDLFSYEKELNLDPKVKKYSGAFALLDFQKGGVRRDNEMSGVGLTNETYWQAKRALNPKPPIHQRGWTDKQIMEYLRHTGELPTEGGVDKRQIKKFEEHLKNIKTKTKTKPRLPMGGPLVAAMLSPLEAGVGSDVRDPKTGVNKYTGKKEYTPFQKGGYKQKYQKGGVENEGKFKTFLHKYMRPFPVANLLLNKFKKNLAENFSTVWGYNDKGLKPNLKRVWDAGVLDRTDPGMQNDPKTGSPYKWEDKDSNSQVAEQVEQNLFRMYLDQEQLGNPEIHVTPSKYKPKGSQQDKTYYSLPAKYREYIYGTRKGKGSYPHKLDLEGWDPRGDRPLEDFLKGKYSGIVDEDMVVGNYTRGVGSDEEGLYLDAQDIFDLNPFKQSEGKYNPKGYRYEESTTKFEKFLGQFGDVSMGIGKPQHIYDRFYYTHIDHKDYPQLFKEGDKGVVIRDDKLLDYLNSRGVTHSSQKWGKVKRLEKDQLKERREYGGYLQKYQKGGRRLYKTGGPKGTESTFEAIPAPVTVSPAEIYLYLTEERGLSANHALGMINNIQHESSFVFGVEGDDVGKMSSGLFQHRGGRRDKLIKYTEGNWATDWRGQIDFALSENDTKKYLKQTFNTPAEASSWFTLNFEKPRDKELKAVSRLKTLPDIMDAITMPIIYPNLKPEVTITPDTQREIQQEDLAKSIQQLQTDFPIDAAPVDQTQFNMPLQNLEVDTGQEYREGGLNINPYATSYPKIEKRKDISSLGTIKEFGEKIFKPKTYKKGRLTLRGKLNEPQIDLGWNPNLHTTPFGGPTLSKPSYSGNISANLRLRKNLSLYGNVDYLSGSQPEYVAGLRLRFKRGGYKSKFCW